MATFFFEVYTKGPNGEAGWEIQVGFVLNCQTREEAVRRVQAHFGDKFDEVIQCYEAVQSDLRCPHSIIE